MVDNSTQVRAAVQRSARAAEKRLNATEAEMRFAADIASGIYTAEMIPSVMDANKIMELADCYIAERAFEPDDVPPQVDLNPKQEDTPSASSNVSISIPYIPEGDVLDMVSGMRASAAPSTDASISDAKGPSFNPYIPSEQEIEDMAARMRASASSSTAPKSPVKKPLIPKKNTKSTFFREFLSWVAIIGIVVFCIVLCIYAYDPDIFSSSTPDTPANTKTIDPPPHSVDYETRYVGSINSDFIHLTTCRYADDILKDNRIYYKSVADAVADGRSKCSVCLSDTSSTTSGSNRGLVPITAPENGHILYEDGSDRVAPFTVKTSGSGYYLIRLRDHYSKDEVLTFFVHGGSEAECDVPLGEFDLSYSFGENWYGVHSKFGDSSYCAKADETFDFYEEDEEVIGWTVTLYAVSGGDLGFDEIPSNLF